VCDWNSFLSEEPTPLQPFFYFTLAIRLNNPYKENPFEKGSRVSRAIFQGSLQTPNR